jgi:hypothetical protein
MGHITQQIIVKHLSIIAACVLLVGCGGSKELDKSRSTTIKSESARFEEEFRPSEYDKDVKVFFSELRKDKGRNATAPEATITEAPIIVTGFRVQLLSTGDIDEVNAKKAEVEAAFPEEWFYVAYDPPTYKLRAGNFFRRGDAEMNAKIFADKGFPDAWVVPEHVLKNTLPRVTPQSQDQQPIK